MNVDTLADRVRARRELPGPAERRAIRQQSGVLLSECAAFCGVTEAAITSWERGERTPRGALLTKYVGMLRLLRGERPEGTPCAA